jgi:hypothetical protein
LPGKLIYTMSPMADDHHSLRIPSWLWRRYAAVVGNVGRGPDLKIFMDWRIDNPDTRLGPDVAPPHDFLATFRVELERWELFTDTVADLDASAELRRYIWWRSQNPEEPLPGRRVPPLQRWKRRPACV